MKEDNLCWFWTFLAVSYIGLWLVITFGFWGGNPEGCFTKIEKLQTKINEQDKRIKTLEWQVANLMTLEIIPERKRRR